MTRSNPLPRSSAAWLRAAASGDHSSAGVATWASRSRSVFVPPAGNVDCVVQRALGADPVRVHRRLTVHNVVVDAVLGVRRPVAQAPQPLGVGLVVADERLRHGVASSHPASRRLTGEHQLAEGAMFRHQRALVVPVDLRHLIPAGQPPGPGVAEPQRRQHVQRRRLRTTVLDGDQHAHVGRRRLGVVDRDRPVPAFVEDAGVDELELGLRLAPRAVGTHDVAVREPALRVVVAPPHERVGRGGVEVPPVLLGVLAVVALRAAQPEDPLLEDLVLAVPQCERETEGLPVIADPGQPVLVPPVGARAGMVVRKVVPRGAVVAVVLPHGAPGALRRDMAPRPATPDRPRRPPPIGPAPPRTAAHSRCVFFTSPDSTPETPCSGAFHHALDAGGSPTPLREMRRPARLWLCSRTGRRSAAASTPRPSWSGWCRTGSAATPWAP